MVSDKFVDQFVTALVDQYAKREEQPTISVCDQVVSLQFVDCTVKIDLNLQRPKQA